MSTTTVPPTPDDFANLHLTTRGGIVLPGTGHYERLVQHQHNAAFHSRKPAMFLICHDADDVSAGVKFATKHGLPLCIRSGGHSACGSSLKDNALVLDLGHLDKVTYDAQTELVDIQPGATLANVNVALLRKGRFTPVGVAPPTGSGGLVLQGGIGFMMHKFGISTDQITAVQVVLASGEIKNLNMESTGDDKELFFAIRGCAGSIGVVTSFTMRTYPQEMVTGGLFMLKDDANRTKGRKLMKLGRQLTESQEAEGTRSLFGAILMANFPPAPDIDPSLHGAPCCLMVMGSAGADAKAAELVNQFVDGDIIVGKPPAPMPFSIFNQLMGVLFMQFPTFANYFAGAFSDFGQLGDAGCDAIADAWNAAPPAVTMAGFTGLELHGGAAGAKHGKSLVGDNDHCVSHIREFGFSIPILLYYPNTEENAPLARKASLDIRAALKPYHTSKGGYSNYNAAPEDEETKQTFVKRDIGNLARVKEIKAKVDPNNLFSRTVAL